MVMYMGIIRGAIVVISIIMLVSTLLSFDVYFVAGVVVVGVVVLGLVAGLIGGIKLLPSLPSIRSLENNDKKAVKLLVNDIKKAHKTIKIVSGTATSKVYNDKKVRNAFKEAIQKGVRIQIVVCNKIDLNKENIITELAEKGMIELYKPREDKVPRNHFRVMDSISVYSEKEHKVNQRHRHSEKFDNFPNVTSRFEEAFDNIITNGKMLYTK